ncbi:MAG: hypothetical protein AMXMBFR59_02500 [Rhodanobacteraceae bacterium]
MVLCPVALAVGCRKCPVFAVCPLKSTIGDYAPEKGTPAPRTATGAAAVTKAAKKATKAATGGRGGSTRRTTRRRPS